MTDLIEDLAAVDSAKCSLAQESLPLDVVLVDQQSIANVMEHLNKSITLDRINQA